MRVDDRLTPLTAKEAVDALAEAFKDVTGARPTPRSLAILVAQTALETGRWKSMHHYNFGNIRGAHQGRWTSFRAGEIGPDGKEYFLEPGPGNKFRAYPGPVEGAQDFIRFLAVDTTGSGSNRYDRAWQAALDGNPRAFVRELKRARYFTADEQRYYDAVKSLYEEFLPMCEAALETRTDPQDTAPDTPAAIARIEQLEERIKALEHNQKALRKRLALTFREGAERLGDGQ